MKFYSFLLFICIPCLSALAQSQTFNYTGAAQTYTVPACVFSIQVDVKGAEGTSVGSSYSTPGKGGRVQATIPVTPGEVLRIYVGQKPSTNTGGWNGGGTGGSQAGGGGGASDIRRGGTGLADRIVVAAGGGGGGQDYGHVYVNTGGDGGGLTGKDGTSNSSVQSYSGKGATQTMGGAGGSGGNENGSPGTSGNGGQADGVAGGGGGGGYFGGGGGGSSTVGYGGGGGGGSNYTLAAAKNITHTRGAQTGNGQVIITAITGPPQAPGSIKGDSLVCSGTTYSYSIDPVTGATAYFWKVPQGAEVLSGADSTTLTIKMGSQSGDLSVRYLGACDTSAASSKHIEVQPQVNAGFTAPDQALVNTEVSFTDTSTGSYFLKWFFGDGDSSVDVNPVHTYTQLGTYEVIQIASNTQCKDTGIRTIEIVDELNGFSGHKQVFLGPLYPNPTSGLVYVPMPDEFSGRSQLRIWDMWGREVAYATKWIGPMENQPLMLDLSHLPNGLYQLEWIQGGKALWSPYPLIKMHE